MSTRFTRVTVALAAVLLVAGCGARAPAARRRTGIRGRVRSRPPAPQPSAAPSQAAVELTLGP